MKKYVYVALMVTLFSCGKENLSESITPNHERQTSQREYIAVDDLNFTTQERKELIYLLNEREIPKGLLPLFYQDDEEMLVKVNLFINKVNQYTNEK